ncbi:MAG: transglycosylase domain-containing protein [Desulfobulbus sp.]|jgi:membrane peptidoglycan carboxypeptidase|uniref:transglycosylase domain-containing protein n=1 Tax=Desulfobulbus sp. TaxID=895 RepID=UPI0028506445|nr:transglycosylase domain-containing protein [Desulfobulbus sp.]MDR2550119.1 transglycosylase domain-containing protein [Desulfobulbus sp.]
MLKLIKYCFLFLLMSSLLAAAIGAGGLYYLVALVPAPEIEESAINEILGRESPVYYRDGQDKLGVLFEGIHRQYLTYDQIPKNFVNALVAAEDNQFFSHFGLDIPGIGRAMLANLRAGKVVQGGSTLTQQTAKNLFKRESRSLQAKLKELLYALRLEHRYSKEKIFEFYTNQFFVSGNGHGLGVAARFFFDKEPKDLTLLECAFIAGSVKRPNYYNPFLKKNLANADEVRQRSEERVRYVLGQMRKNHLLGEEEYKGLNLDELVFKQGKMSYAQNTAMDLVREGLSTPFIADILEQNGISNIATSGARIITTLDHPLQRKTVEGLRRHLSQLDVRLRGYERAMVQEEYKALEYQGDEELLPGNFVFGTIKDIGESRDKGLEVRVHFDEGRAEGIVDTAGLNRMADAYARFSRGAQTASPADRKALLRQMQAGDKVYVAVRENDGHGKVLLDLERYPQVEGAAFVLQEGAIRAMSGGMSNLNFNRATTAKRLMGSTFKTFLFAAALQLGWSPVDMISNSRDTFVFMNRPYAPQPDHDSPFGSVSLSWAGVTSENVAAVWLLYHLTDHLTPPMIRELAAKVDMAPRIDEDGRVEAYQHYRERMRDHFGIQLSRQYLDYAAFGNAVRALQPDFVFDNREDEYRRLAQMRYDDFQHLRSLVDALGAYRRALGSGTRPVNPDAAFDDPGTPALPNAAGHLVRDGAGRFIFTLRPDLPANWTPLSVHEVVDQLIALDPGEFEDFWLGRVQLEGMVSATTVQQVENQLGNERGKLNPEKLYSLDVLGEVRDFRVMLGLQYLVQLARECGINSRFEPVLSLPLGSNVVSLSEITRTYETMITGNRHDAADAPTLAQSELDGHVDPDGAAIIDRIETPEGRVVYSRQVYRTRVFDPKSAAGVSNILQNVIPYGTGRYALEHVRLRSDDPDRNKILAKLNQPYPLLGKTGTANDYRNSAFVGYVPALAPDQSGIGFQGGYTVGVYAGFDNNATMVRRGFRVTGSQGALPAWSAIAQAVLDTEKIADRLDPVDLTFNGLSLQYPEVKQVFMPVAPNQGGAMTGAAGLRQTTAPGSPASLCFGAVGASGRFEPERLFLPYWRNR